MARTIVVNGEVITLSPEEDAKLDTEEAEWRAGEKDRHNADMQEKRAFAYAAEADPLFFKAQRGEATMQQWQDKVEIGRAHV